jgi:hypothetical protein
MRKYLHGEILGIIIATKCTYRTTTVMKVETDINTRTTVSLDTTSCDTSDNVC